MPSNAMMDKAKGVIRGKGKRVFMDKFIDRHRAANRSTNRQIQMAMQRQVAVNQNDPTSVSRPLVPASPPPLPCPLLTSNLSLQDPDRAIPAARRAEAAVHLELFGTVEETHTDPDSAEGLRLREAALVPGSSAAAPPVRARNPTALVSAADLEALLGENKEALDAAANKPQKGSRARKGGAGNKNKKERAGRGKKGEGEEDSDLPSFASSAYPGAPTDGSIIPRGLMHVNRGFWPKAVRERVEKAEAAEAEAARSTRAEMRKADAVERRKERERKREREREMERLRKRELRERKIREEKERRMREKKEKEEREKAKEAPSSGAKKRKADAVENESDEDEDPVVVPMRKFRRVAKPSKE